jgi:hypothetical protein
MAYLDSHPPARPQFRAPRRQPVSGVVVVHTAENTPDLAAFDGGAEAVARFIVGRDDPGSYHDLCDSDSCINLVAYWNEAYHDGTGSNRHSYGVSVATRADVWPLAPERWRDGAVKQAAAAAARYARWVKNTRGIVIPARRITRDQSERLVPGFISHAERDPSRRTDPGAAFPWRDFLSEYARLMGQTTGGGLLADLTDKQQGEMYAWLKRVYEETAADDPEGCRLGEVTLGVRRLLADRRPAGYFAKVADESSLPVAGEPGVVWWVTADSSARVGMEVGGALHEHLKALMVEAGYEERAELLDADVLEAIPVAGGVPG